MVKGSFSFNSRRTMRMRGPPKIILRNSQLKGKSHLSSTLMRVKLVHFKVCAAKLSLTISISISLDTESCETILDIPTTYSTGQTIVQGEIGTLFIDGFQRTLK